jgi:pimeloyl-ACP methyl ester carboxylesterase
MQRVVAQTAFGPVPTWGRFESFQEDRPLLLAIRGAFASADYLNDYADRLPGFDVVVAGLPGLSTVWAAEVSVTAFALAFDDIIRAHARPSITAMGVSVGALVAMALREPARIVAVEPPLSTAKLWPLRRWALRALHDGMPALHERWMWSILGYTADQAEGRDYLPILNNLNQPVEVVAGDLPLFPVREVGVMPSLLGNDDRRLLAAHPLIRLEVAQGAGHDVPKEAPDTLATLIADQERDSEARAAHRDGIFRAATARALTGERRRG